MNEKYDTIKETLEEYGQEHLLARFNDLSKEKQEELLNELFTINFSKIKQIYENKDNLIQNEYGNIMPLKGKSESELGEEFLHDRQVGTARIKQNKLAVVTMAGGQGTRLGHNGPKGTYMLDTATGRKSIFEILCETLKRANKEYGVYPNWYLMTSDENNDETIKFFEENNYFNYPRENIKFFKQGKMPLIDENGKILIGEDDLVKEAADGHGGVFQSLYNNGMIRDMKTKGVEWVFIGGVDNILVEPIDPVFLGMAINNHVQAGAKSVEKREPAEKVGVLVRRQDGRPTVIEYSEMSEEMQNEKDINGNLRYKESHILCNLFSVDAIENLSQNDLPYHIAHKKAAYKNEKGEMVEPNEPNAYKLEKFMFDAFSELNDMVVYRVKREREFGPIKNKEGKDSPYTAVTLYNKKMADIKEKDEDGRE